MKQFFLEIEGMQVNYYISGYKEKPTIVCLHGLAGSATYSFAELLNLLSDQFNMIAIDQPGHGKSSPFKNEEDYLFSNLAQWYAKVFGLLLNNKPFYLLGHSWGADVALHYAKYFPANIKGVIILDGGFTFPEYQEEMTYSKAYSSWSQYMDGAKFDKWDDVVGEYRQYTKRWNINLEKELSTIFTKNKNEEYELISSKFSVLSIINAFFREPFTTTYSSIKAPLLLLHATEPRDLDQARQIGISELQKSIEDVSIVAVNNTGHMVQWDKPNEVAVEIKLWIMGKEG